MFLSRVVAARRIDRRVRPSWWGAWGLVIADGVLMGLAVWALWGPVAGWAEARALGLPLLFGLMFAVFFIPIQGVMILSALWAAKSRWSDETRDPT